MKKILFIAFTIALCGCGGHSHGYSGETSSEHVHIHGFTAYSHALEFYMQHEGLVAGQKSCITLYVTTLENFKPVAAEEAKASLKLGGNEHTMQVKAGQKGVFHFDFIPASAGKGVLEFEVGGEASLFNIEVHGEEEAHSHDHSHGEHGDSDGHSHEHSHGEHGDSDGHSHEHSHGEHGDSDGHSHEHSHGEHSDCDGHSHEHSHGEHSDCDGHSHVAVGVVTEGKAGDVSFSKEQSWKIDFATGLAVEDSFVGAIKVVAKVETIPSNFTTIVATANGKVQFVGNMVTGKEVSYGEPVFYLEGGDVTDNDAAVRYAEAESDYEVAKADFERKKLLFIDKIVSERDYQAAEAAYKQAEVRFNSMKRNFNEGKVILRSEIDGFVSELLVSHGDYVEPGTPLAVVQRGGDMNILAELPVRYAAQLSNIESVNMELPSGKVCSVDEVGGRVLAVGKSVNGCDMLPLTITIAKLEELVPGSIVTLYINSADAKSKGVVVPRTALVEEMGNFFVFVQNSPVSFEKRSVKVGNTDGRRVRLESGVKAGERVVTKGAVVLKLSQGAAALDPHAGHVH